MLIKIFSSLIILVDFLNLILERANLKIVKNFFNKKNRLKRQKNKINNINNNNNSFHLTKSSSAVDSRVNGQPNNRSNIIKKIKREKNKKRAKLMLIIKIAALLLLLLLGFKVFSVVGKFNKKLNLNDIGLSETDEAAERQISDITNILLLGIDDNNVSDAIMIASIDKSNKNLKLISIARDSLVPIESPKNKKTYYSKINEAYSNGGESTTLKTLNKNFNIRLMDYITINFEGLVDVIDSLGGLDIEISKKESRDIDGIINTTKSLKRKHYEKLNGKFGQIHLNGSQAVAYVRIRKTETLNGLNDDFGRAFRQRLVMGLVFEKIMNLGKANIPGLIKTLLPHMKTSLSFKTIFNIYSCVKGKNFEFKTMQVPLPEYTIDPDYIYNSKSTVFYDLDYAGKLINEVIYENADPKTFIEEHPPKIEKIKNSKNNNDNGGKTIKHQESTNNQNNKHNKKRVYDKPSKEKFKPKLKTSSPRRSTQTSKPKKQFESTKRNT